LFTLKAYGGSEEDAERVAPGKERPSGLKPYCKQSKYDTTEVVPLTKFEFFITRNKEKGRKDAALLC